MTILRLASYNIQYGMGKDGRFDLARIAADLGCSANASPDSPLGPNSSFGPDIIALQEVERFCARSGMVDQAEALSALLPHMHWVYGPGIDVDASVLQGGKVVRRRRQYGNMVMSRWPILSAVTHPLPKLGLTNIFHQQRCLVETVIATPAGALRFCSVHLDNVAPETRMPQVQMMMELALNGAIRGGNWGGESAARRFEQPEPPMPADVVIMGDMNFNTESGEYDRVIGERSQWHGRMVLSGGLADAWVAAGHDEASGDTIPHPDPGVGPRRIDHCFLSARLAPFVTAARIGVEAQGSDHQPVFFDLDVPGPLR